MKILFVAYCLIDANGDSLIGVFKRCLRIGLEMQRRGHEVHLCCTGQDDFHDPLIEKAAQLLHTFDVPRGVLSLKSAAARRRFYDPW